MDQEQEIRQITMFILKGGRITLDMIQKAINKNMESYENRNGEKSLSTFKENMNSYQKTEIENLDRDIFREISKKYNLVYSVEFDKKQNVSYVLFSTSVDKINDLLKEYNEKIEIKNKIKTSRKNLINKTKTKTKDIINKVFGKEMKR